MIGRESRDALVEAGLGALGAFASPLRVFFWGDLLLKRGPSSPSYLMGGITSLALSALVLAIGILVNEARTRIRGKKGGEINLIGGIS